MRGLPLSVETSILTIDCPTCNSPIFFGWQDNPTTISCKNCQTIAKVIFNGRFEIATFMDLKGQITIKCTKPECNKVFVVEDVKDNIVPCPYCQKRYYVHVGNPEFIVKSILGGSQKRLRS